MEPLASDHFARRLPIELDRAEMTELQMAHRVADRLGHAVDSTLIRHIVDQRHPIRLDEAAIIADELGLSLLELVSETPGEDIDARIASLWAERTVAEARMVRADAAADLARDDMIRIDKSVRTLVAQGPRTTIGN